MLYIVLVEILIVLAVIAIAFGVCYTNPSCGQKLEEYSFNWEAHTRNLTPAIMPLADEVRHG